MRRRWKHVGLLIAGLAVLPLLIGLGGPAEPAKLAKVVNAEKFVLRDAAGKARAELGLQAGQPALALFDEQGSCRARLVVSADGSTRLSFHDSKGRLRAMFSVPQEGEPRLELANQRQPSELPSLAVPAASGPESPTPSDGRTRAAQGLFHRLCITCHGADGRGRQSPSRPNLPDFTSATWQARRTNAQLTASILNGRGNVMPAFRDRLSANQARDLVAFVRAFGPAPVPPIDPPADNFEVRFWQLMHELDELKKQMRDLSSPPRKP